MPTVRPYRPGDWSNFLELDLQTGLTRTEISAAEQEQFRNRWPKVLHDRFGMSEKSGPAPKHGEIFVLESEDGAYAGHLWLQVDEDFFTGRERLFITTVSVSSAFRGQGLGKYLMRFAEKEAQSRGLEEIVLGVAAANEAAVGLYRKLGYSVTRLSMSKTVRAVS